jgi:uncharacterized membrane protein (UPF0127 family)
MSTVRMRVRRLGDEAIICRDMVLGESFGQRFMGLMGRAALPEGEGLYLRTSSIHMMFMRFAIDALFVSASDASGSRRVVAVRPELPPWRGIVLPVRGAEAVVELPAGTLARHDVSIGQEVVFEPATEEAATISSGT